MKVADFGSCRGIFSKPPYTEYISTRWYRAPECLLTDGYYDHKMDIWGVGCVMFEIISLYPLFPGTNELDQIDRIHNIRGSPSREILKRFQSLSSNNTNFNFPPRSSTNLRDLIPHTSPDTIDLLEDLLEYDPEKRISARQALMHPYFRECVEAEKRVHVPHPISPNPGEDPWETQRTLSHATSVPVMESVPAARKEHKHHHQHRDRSQKREKVRSRLPAVKHARMRVIAPPKFHRPPMEQSLPLIGKKIDQQKHSSIPSSLSKHSFAARHYRVKKRKQKYSMKAPYDGLFTTHKLSTNR
eukprot:998210_1